MITNPSYIILAREIAEIFCEGGANQSICIISVKQRIIESFTDQTFEYFLANIQKGRMYMLQLRNWHQGTNCRHMAIDSYYTDVLTGAETHSAITYTARNCTDKHYYYPDLNHAMKQRVTVLDPLITANTNAEVTRKRLVYAPGAPSYNIVFTNQGGGGTPKIIPKPPAHPTPPGGTPTLQAAPGEDGNILEGVLEVLSNPIVLAGLGVGIYFLFKKYYTIGNYYLFVYLMLQVNRNML